VHDKLDSRAVLRKDQRDRVVVANVDIKRAKMRA